MLRRSKVRYYEPLVCLMAYHLKAENAPLEQPLSSLKTAVVVAGDHVREMKPLAQVVRQKGINDVVTNVDLEAHQHLERSIEQLFPGEPIVSEEGASSVQRRGKAGIVWFIDPIDGTNNFRKGFPFYSISVCRFDMERNLPLLSFVYLPEFDQLFEAAGPDLACLNSHSISPTRTEDLRDTLVLTGFSHSVEPDDPQLMKFCEISVKSGGTRRSGCASIDLCYVAAGFADAYYHHSLSIWDFAAGMHVVTAAGGHVTNINGDRISIASNSILATNGKCHRQLLRSLDVFK